MKLDTLESYSGTIWAIETSVYNSEEPEIEDGVFEDEFFNDENEARWAYGERVASLAAIADDVFKKEPDDHFDTVGMFLCCRQYSNGQDVNYYEGYMAAVDMYVETSRDDIYDLNANYSR